MPRTPMSSTRPASSRAPSSSPVGEAAHDVGLQQALDRVAAAGHVGVAGLELVAQVAQEVDERLPLRPVRLLQLAPDVLGHHRARPSGGDRERQLAAAHDRGHDEVAQRRDVDHVAEHVHRLGVLPDHAVDRVQVGRGDHQEAALEVLGPVGPRPVLGDRAEVDQRRQLAGHRRRSPRARRRRAPGASRPSRSRPGRRRRPGSGGPRCPRTPGRRPCRGPAAWPGRRGCAHRRCRRLGAGAGGLVPLDQARQQLGLAGQAGGAQAQDDDVEQQPEQHHPVEPRPRTGRPCSRGRLEAHLDAPQRPVGAALPGSSTCMIVRKTPITASWLTANQTSIESGMFAPLWVNTTGWTNERATRTE